MAIFPRGVIINHGDIAVAVERAALKLRPTVVHVRYSVGRDWSDDPAIFFRVLLSDAASGDKQLPQQITSVILQEVNPQLAGLQPYFNFRSVSEQRVLKEEAWA
ncbi:MAG: hypothetical protein U0R19_11655 [Bryobacteraceae bacterium]